MRLIVAAAIGAAAFSSIAHAQEASAPDSCALRESRGVAEHRLRSSGRERTYRLFVPPGYDERTRLPLVLDLHGSGGTAAGQALNSRFEELAAREGVLVATLQAVAQGNRWNIPVTEEGPDDVQYVA